MVTYKDKWFSIRGRRRLDVEFTRRIKLRKAQDRISVVVGYRSNYALWVHEAVGMKLKGEARPSGIGTYWSPSGATAKFLEIPSRTLTREILRIVVNVTKFGQPLFVGLWHAGKYLLSRSLEIVPVETGELKSSGYSIYDKR